MHSLKPRFCPHMRKLCVHTHWTYGKPCVSREISPLVHYVNINLVIYGQYMEVVPWHMPLIPIAVYFKWPESKLFESSPKYCAITNKTKIWDSFIFLFRIYMKIKSQKYSVWLFKAQFLFFYNFLIH